MPEPSVTEGAPLTHGSMLACVAIDQPVGVSTCLLIAQDIIFI